MNLTTNMKSLKLGVIGIDHGHIFDMLDEMLKEGFTCDYFWSEGDPLTLNEFNTPQSSSTLESSLFCKIIF